MRRADELPQDPDVVGGLEAIDAALAGRPVDPGCAELAELALTMAADRPQMDPAFGATLDERLARSRTTRPERARRLPRWWVWTPAAGLAACLLAAVVIVTQEGGRAPARTSTALSRT